MNRRTMLRLGGMAAAGFGAAACGVRGTRPAGPPPRPLAQLAPLNVAWDRIIRTSVGLRPFRRSGFRIEVEKFGDTTVVHHYGHGGGGVSLSWGTAALAADLAIDTGHRRAAVIGCGAVGLATARTLQRRGFEVTIYAKDIPPGTTSDHAPAAFTPGSRVIDFGRRSAAFDARYVRAAETAFHAWQHLVGDHYGVRWMYNYSPTEEIPDEIPEGGGTTGGLGELTPGTRGERVILGPGEHPFHTPYALRRANLMFETPVFLAATLHDFLLWGGRLVPRTIASPQDLMALPEPLVLTCVGLGGHALFGDDDIVPVKGQLAVLMPQPEVDYMLSPGGGLNMVPRRDGIMLGTTGQLGEWSTALNEDEHRRIVDGHIAFAAAWNGAAAAADIRHARQPPQPLPVPRTAVEAPPTRDWFLDQLSEPGL